MPWSDSRLVNIYDRTEGYCSYCGKRLSLNNYGILGAKGAWEVDHRNPRSRGGSDRLGNLSAACIPCNRVKSDRHARSYRRDWEPATLGGKVVEFFGLPEGFFGASRRRRPR